MTTQTQTETAVDGRTEPRRFDADETLAASDLIVGDRIDPKLVGPAMRCIDLAHSPAGDSDATVQLAEATITRSLDDVHVAILVDGESGVMVRAERHDSQAAWTQQEADWKVRDVGTRVSVTDATVDTDADDEWADADTAAEAEGWANVVLQDRARGSTDYADELTVDGASALILNNPWGATVHAEFELVD